MQEDIILSPDSRELADYEEYCRRELPRTFRAALEEIVHNESQPIEESIRNQLMNIIRDCQDRVFSSYRSSSAAIAAVGTPSRNSMTSRSPLMTSQELITTISISSEATSGSSLGRVTPPFFHPPPPQIHLGSRLEVSDLQSNPFRAPDGSDPSDSGYSSNELGMISGGSSSFNTSRDGASLSKSQPQPASDPVPAHAQSTWEIDNGQFDMNSGNGVLHSHETGTFDNSWWENDPQLVDENTWNLHTSKLLMEDPFSD